MPNSARVRTSRHLPIVFVELMRLFAFVAAVLAFTSVASGGGGQVLGAHGVEATVPAGWERVASAGDGPVIDPLTLLVLGTAGVRAKPSQCQIAAYRIPPGGAVVVIVGWKTATSGGGRMKPGSWPLKMMTSVRRPSFECFAGRGAAASLVLGGKAYQVNVMVGGSASSKRIAEALAVGRSFRLAP
jgi:hypothetical protein